MGGRLISSKFTIASQTNPTQLASQNATHAQYVFGDASRNISKDSVFFGNATVPSRTPLIPWYPATPARTNIASTQRNWKGRLISIGPSSFAVEGTAPHRSLLNSSCQTNQSTTEREGLDSSFYPIRVLPKLLVKPVQTLLERVTFGTDQYCAPHNGLDGNDGKSEDRLFCSSIDARNTLLKPQQR
ncbi:hypothetical protein ACWV27_14670 [Massilia varians]